jgi:chorismate lyase/3-hydroxybenzoate synthase
MASPNQTAEAGVLSQIYLPAAGPVHPPEGQHLLGIVNHLGQGIEGHSDDAVPTACLAMDVIGDNPRREAWYTHHPVQYGTLGNIRYARSDELLFGVAHYPADDLDQVTSRGYRDLIRLIRLYGAGQLIRLWNFFPRINESQDQLERYRRFCRGRHEALADMGYALDADLPAATAIGSREGDFWIIFLAGQGIRIQVENPLQMSAFRYPPIYGPRSPSFSRAVRYLTAQGDHLFISGTASIRGHESAHSGEITGQCQVTLQNLCALLNQAGVEDLGQLGSRASWKVYLRRADDYETVRACLRQALDPASPLLFVIGDICRESLLLEIEGLVNLHSHSVKC